MAEFDGLFDAEFDGIVEVKSRVGLWRILRSRGEQMLIDYHWKLEKYMLLPRGMIYMGISQG